MWKPKLLSVDNGHLHGQKNKAETFPTKRVNFWFLWSLFFSKHHKRISFSFLLGHLQVQGWNNTERINFLDRITQANKMQTEKKNSFLFFLANIITYILSRNLHSKVIFPRPSSTEIQETCFCSRNESKTLYIYKSDLLKSWHHYLFWSLYSCVLT